MDSYDDLILAARQWTPDQRTGQLKRLMQHPDFAAMAGLIDYFDRQFASDASSPKTAVSHGALAHAAGAKHGIEVLQSNLRGIYNGSVKPAKA